MAILDDLDARMAQAAADGDFETAAALRDAIARIRSGESNLREQVPGRMGLGTSQEDYVRDPKRGLPVKPDPMTKGHKPGGRRRGEPDRHRQAGTREAALPEPRADP